MVASVIDFLLSHINSLLNSRIYVWPEVRCRRFLKLVKKKKKKKGSRGLRSCPACGDQCKHSGDRHPLLTHWSILAGCEHQGEAVASRWACLQCSLLNSPSSIQPAPEDVFLLFIFIINEPIFLNYIFLSNFLFAVLNLCLKSNTGFELLEFRPWTFRGNIKLTYFSKITWKYSYSVK